MERTSNCCYTSAITFLAVLLLSAIINGGSEAADQNGSCDAGGGETRKLFVFGDSYADTGNLPKIQNLVRCWYVPYGITFPHRPTGRFSDGRVLTDFVATLMGIKSPIPYKYRRFGAKLLPYGMNFAYGGAGIFDTGILKTNLGTQIDQLVGQVTARVFSACDLRSSVALVVISGNDYSHLRSMDPDYMKHIYTFMKRLFVQFKSDLERFRELGIPKVVVTRLHPIGFTPYLTRKYNYTHGPPEVMRAVLQHNKMLHQMLRDLEKSSSHDKSSSKTFLALDVYKAFMKVIRQANGARKFKYPLVPCCEGNSESNNCGEVDGKEKQYKLCRRPEEHFYWDTVHPTQAGWAAAFHFLRPSLRKFLLS